MRLTPTHEVCCWVLGSVRGLMWDTNPRDATPTIPRHPPDNNHCQYLTVPWIFREIAICATNATFLPSLWYVNRKLKFVWIFGRARYVSILTLQAPRRYFSRTGAWHQLLEIDGCLCTRGICTPKKEQYDSLLKRLWIVMRMAWSFVFHYS